jgi:hypothetical protein
MVPSGPRPGADHPPHPIPAQTRPAQPPPTTPTTPTPTPQDLLWSNDFDLPRLGQGAFAVCLEALCEKVRLLCLVQAQAAGCRPQAVGS